MFAWYYWYQNILFKVNSGLHLFLKAFGSKMPSLGRKETRRIWNHAIASSPKCPFFRGDTSVSREFSMSRRGICFLEMWLNATRKVSQNIFVIFKTDRCRVWRYFTSCVLPGMRADAACRAIWRERGMRHCLCTDGAPRLVRLPGCVWKNVLNDSHSQKISGAALILTFTLFYL